MHSERPIRILHIVGGMNRGGVETWLMHVLRHIDRDRFQMDFLVHTTKPCDFDDEIRALGSQVIPCLHPSRPFVYARNLRRLLREHGPYDVVHSHVHHYSGWTLRIAHQAGVPVRVAHSHSDTFSVQAAAGLVRRGYLRLMRTLIHRHAICPSGTRSTSWRPAYSGLRGSPCPNISSSGHAIKCASLRLMLPPLSMISSIAPIHPRTI